VATTPTHPLLPKVSSLRTSDGTRRFHIIIHTRSGLNLKTEAGGRLAGFWRHFGAGEMGIKKPELLSARVQK